MYAWILLLCAPCLASAIDKDAVFQSFLSQLSSNFSEHVPLPDAVHMWRQTILPFWTELGIVSCTKGEAGPLPPFEPSHTRLVHGEIMGTAVLSQFPFDFGRCTVQVGKLEAVDSYAGTVGGGSARFSLLLQDSEEGCRVKFNSMFDYVQDLNLVEDVLSIKTIVKALNQLEGVKANFKDDIVEGMNNYLSQFKEMVLPERCPSS